MLEKKDDQLMIMVDKKNEQLIKLVDTHAAHVSELMVSHTLHVKEVTDHFREEMEAVTAMAKADSDRLNDTLDKLAQKIDGRHM